MRAVNPTAGESGILELFMERGLDCPDIELRFRFEKSSRTMETPFRTTDEGFRIVSSKDGKSAELVYASLRGLYYGLISLTGGVNLPAKLQREQITDFFDYPRFALRGIIEGFYGPPWSGESRRNMIKMLPEFRMNSYFYGPKDDPYHRSRWAEPYPGAELSEIAELVELCGKNEVDFWYGIGPGLSIKYSSPEDRKLLCAKLLQLYGTGIRHFGLYLDDVPGTLQHEEDKSAYTDLVEAQISLINEIYQFLQDKDPAARLAVCPGPYWGEPGYYITRMGAEIDPRILIFHTGPEICSRELKLRDAAEMERITNRPVLYWDNYPVNDLEMAHRLHIGPYRNRDPHLYRASAGVIANGMEYPEASKIPFFTIGDYLWNPETYDPETSFRAAVKRVAGETDAEDFFPFADNNRASCLYPNDSTAFRKAVETFGFALKKGERDSAVSILNRELERLEKAAALFGRGMNNRRLENEISPWTGQYLKAVEILRLVAEILSRPDNGKNELISALEKIGSEYQAERWYVFSDVMTSFIKEVTPLLKECQEGGSDE